MLLMEQYIGSGEEHTQAYSLQPGKHGRYENPETCRVIAARDPVQSQVQYMVGQSSYSYKEQSYFEISMINKQVD